MPVMKTFRASNFLYLVMGALSVAIVATVLVASGVFDRDTTGAAHASATVTATPAAASSRSAAVPTDVSDIYRSVSPGVVYIASTTSQGQASGSGWVYSSSAEAKCSARLQSWISKADSSSRTSSGALAIRRRWLAR